MQNSATAMAKRLDISRAYLYYIINNNNIVVITDDNGKPVWNDETYNALREYVKKSGKDKKNDDEIVRSSELKDIHIQNRRFLGNKYKLLSFIRDCVDKECGFVDSFADIFSGTGAVASAFTDKKLICNDIMYSNYICNVAWFDPQGYDENKLCEMISYYNSCVISSDNYMSENFADTYFSENDCRKIGFVREDIEKKFNSGLINNRERALLITSLIFAMDKIANTCGHYDAYRQGVTFDKALELALPKPPENLNPNNVICNEDANELADMIEADLVYIDPPYNSRQYCDAYHLLENVARWEKPEVSGVAKKFDRSHLKSKYCTKEAAIAFEELIKKIKAKYILLSYNNMAQKGNDRSNAKISDEDIIRILSAKGEVSVFEQSYKTFSAGKSDIKNNKERLFLCKCTFVPKEIIQSPLNYTGGKYKLLSKMLPHFPSHIDKAVDLFCGGGNVGINLDCSQVLFNDNNKDVIGMLGVFQQKSKKEIFEFLDNKIKEYGLSDTRNNGYDYYKCNSSTGLGAYNKERYLRLRDSFNSMTDKDDDYYLTLYLLIVFAFNNQIRFNKFGEFNLPVGKRDFNDKMRKKLSLFSDRIRSGDYTFKALDFRDMDIDTFTKNSFFYMDPPYLIGTATYNEQKGWTKKDEVDLLAFIDKLDQKGIRFALSNLLESKGKKNDILAEWLEKNKDRYKVIDMYHDYSNSNYHTTGRDEPVREIMVINY